MPTLTELTAWIYLGDVVVGLLLLGVLLTDRQTYRMSTPHMAFFYAMACGLLVEGLCRLSEIKDPDLYTLTLMVRKVGWYGFVFSLALRQIRDRIPMRKFA